MNRDIRPNTLLRESTVMTPSASVIFEKLVTALRIMDAEALPVNGKPTGLNWYGGWARPDLKRPQTEVEWTKVLAKRLGCQREIPYPSHPKKRCDLVVDRTCWIEVKGLWPAYWAAQGQRAIYEAYLFDPLKSSKLGKSHTAARDVIKLGGLLAKDAAVVGLVLVGFDSVREPCNADISEFAQLAGLGSWWHGSAAWEDAQMTGQMVKVWGWFHER